MPVIRREGLAEALTNDHHFEQEGFKASFDTDRLHRKTEPYCQKLHTSESKVGTLRAWVNKLPKLRITCSSSVPSLRPQAQTKCS